MEAKEKNDEKVPFEEALNRVGYGLYSHLMTALAGVIIMSLMSVVYSTTIVVPTSACELGTTTAQQGLIAGSPVIGEILGGVIWGSISDKKGRRNVLLVSLLSGGTVSALASLSVHWVMLMVLQFVAAFLASSQFALAMIILSESVPMAKRNQVVLVVSSIFTLYQGILAVIAIPIIPLSFSHYLPALGIYWNSWRTVLVVYSLPAFISAVWLYFMQESPKFVFAKGDEEGAINILKTIHRINNLGSMKELQLNGILPDEPQVVDNSGPTNRSQLEIFRPPLLKYTMIMSALYMGQLIGGFHVWLPTIADQFVSIMETGEGADLNLCAIIRASLDAPVDDSIVPCSLNTTALLIVLVMSAIMSITNVLITLVVDRVGRRNMVMILTALCGSCGIIVNVIPNAIGSAVMFGIFLFGILGLGLYTAITVALFPTHLRGLAVSFTMTGGRVITFAAIQLLNYLLANNCEVGFYLSASIFASLSIVASLLPDDRYLKPAAEEPRSIEDSVKND